MAATRRVLRRENIGGFSTIHVLSQVLLIITPYAKLKAIDTDLEMKFRKQISEMQNSDIQNASKTGCNNSNAHQLFLGIDCRV